MTSFHFFFGWRDERRDSEMGLVGMYIAKEGGGGGEG